MLAGKSHTQISLKYFFSFFRLCVFLVVMLLLGFLLFVININHASCMCIVHYIYILIYYKCNVWRKEHMDSTGVTQHSVTLHYTLKTILWCRVALLLLLPQSHILKYLALLLFTLAVPLCVLCHLQVNLSDMGI